MLKIPLEITLVFRSRRGLNLRPVHRIKHVVDLQGGIAAAGQSNTALVTATDTPALANTDEVETGSTVNGIYLKVEVTRTGVASGVVSNVYLIIFKNPGGNLTTPPANTVGQNDDKRFVIHQEMILLQGQDNSNPRTLFNGVIAIPRGYRRFGPNDLLVIGIKTPGVAINFCYQAHYKEFR